MYNLLNRVLWVLKILVLCFVWNFEYLRKLHRTNILRMPRKFYHRFMYIAPSSVLCIEWTLICLFKLILRRFEVVFWCLEWECCRLLKDFVGNSFKSTHTIALKKKIHSWNVGFLFWKHYYWLILNVQLPVWIQVFMHSEGLWVTCLSRRLINMFQSPYM